MKSNAARNKSRRRFLLGGLGVTGAMIVGWGFMPPRQRLTLWNPLASTEDLIPLNGWIRIAKDNSIMLAMPRSEMGQGVHTALPMMVAEELDVPLSMVNIEQAPVDKIFGNVSMLADGLPFHPEDDGIIKNTAVWLTSKFARELGLNVTGGSSSMKDAWSSMRIAAATARRMLIEAAAKKWRVKQRDCVSDGGFITHKISGRRESYGELAALAAFSEPEDVRPKDPKNYRIIGTDQPRRDTPVKVNGSAVFGIDARPQGLIYAAVTMSPTIGGRVKSFDAAPVLGMPGVLHALDYSADAQAAAGVAVLARTWWQAKKALAAMPIVWEAGPHVGLSTETVFADLKKKLDTEEGFTYFKRGDMDSVKAGAKLIKAEYRAPFLAHATMEPINCTAQVWNGKVNLWVSTQVPTLCIAAAAQVAKVDKDQVSLTVTYLGGGFGRRLEVDMVRQAVAIAMSAGGSPVQVIWSREDDMTHDMYRPAAIASFTAALNGAGNVLSWDNKSAGGSVTQQVIERSFGLEVRGPDKSAAEGEFDLPYEIPNQKVVHVITPTPVPLGFWRSVGHSHNAFFTESFIDELAHATGKGPIDFRRVLLQEHPRHLAVLNAAVSLAGTPAEGHAHGVALHQSFGSIVAQVAEVSIDGGLIRVHKVSCAVDCGIAINSNLISQQMESAVTYGLTAALMGEITIKAGKVEQSNFHDYPLLRMNQMPVVETVVMDSSEPPEGMGEPGVPPIAPAVANAVFILTGKRLRSLPLTL